MGGRKSVACTGGGGWRCCGDPRWEVRHLALPGGGGAGEGPAAQVHDRSHRRGAPPPLGAEMRRLAGLRTFWVLAAQVSQCTAAPF